MKFVALYARVSTLNQESGLEAQVRALESYCKTNGIKSFKIYSDEVSGRKSKRPGLDAMIADVEGGLVTAVVVYSLSRFSRSVKHLLESIDRLSQLKVGFVSLTEALDTKTPSGRAVITILSAVAQLERELIVERVKNGLANAKAKGRRLGRPKKRNGELIKALHAKGMSHRQIAKLARCSTWAVCEELKERLEIQSA